MEVDSTIVHTLIIKWFGTAVILLKLDGSQILFDPFFGLNNSLMKFYKEEFSSLNAILVTHEHFDHISGIPSIIKQNETKIYCTAKTSKKLISKGIKEELINNIKPGNSFCIGSFEVCVFIGKHIVFNIGIIIKTLFNLRILSYLENLRYILKENKNKMRVIETLVFYITVSDKRILLLGSLNLAKNTEYPKGADLLILPFQGRSDLNTYALSIIKQLEPKKILLDHFDDTYPPVSSPVDTNSFIILMKEKYPSIPVICLNVGSELAL
jgi:L-ascorbate metabolism protein UlaG (beta-lactamase superfamily)